MAEQPKNQIIVIEPVTKTVNELLEMITDRGQAEIQPFLSADEAIQCTRQFVPCMLVVCIQSNNDIPAILGTLKQLKPDIKAGMVKTLLVSKVKNPQLQKLIGEFGVTDYIEEPIPARTLQFKANLQLKAIDTTRKQIELRKKNDEKIVFKTSKTAQDEAQTTGTEIKTRNKPALQLANDTFLIKNGSVKKQGKKFVVELDGPDPSTGEWVSDGEEKDGETNWRWKPHDKEDEPGAEEGDGWVSTGDRPVFKPANKKWQMSSEKPSLVYKKKKIKVAEKIGTDEKGEVEVADDSPAAEENLKKNLVKSMRKKKRKAAEAAGVPYEEDEEEKAEKAKAAAPAEEEEETGSPAALPRVKRKVKRPKLDAKGQPIPGEEEEVEEEVDAAEEEPESEGRKKLEKLRKARKAKKEGAPAAGLPAEEGEAEESEATEAPAEEEEEGSSPSPLAKRQKKKARAAKADGQLLDFLQKKKEQVKPAQQAAEEEAPEDPADTPSGEEEPEELSKAAALLKRARERKAQARKNGVAGIEDALSAGEEKPEEAESGKEDESAEKIGTRKNEEEPAEASEEDDELQKEARERKRKREAKKKALLEEIQEESEPSAEELETIERKRKAKAEGSEEEAEEEEAPERNERLEKLRRKREELAALEREEEEEEKQGDHLHTLRAEERRGMNAWDTDESVEADDEETKRLKRLEREKREAAERAEREREEKERREALEAQEAEEEKKARKKRIAEGTQADGLEDAFAKDEPEAKGEDLYATDEEAPEGETRSERLDRLRAKRDEEKAAKANAESATEEQGKEAKPEAAAEAAAEENEELSLKEKIEKKKAEKEALAATEEEETSAKEAKEESAGKEKPAAEAEETAKKKEVVAEAEAEKPRAEEISEDFSRKRSEEAPAAALSAKEKLAEKSKTSESMKKFLERRKQKKEAGEIDLGLGKKENAEDPGKRSFLSIFVAISDSFGMASDRKILNILRAFEMSLENCAVALTTPGEGTVRVMLASSLEKGSDLPLAGCRVETFSDEQGAPVGHLVLRMLEPRTAFENDESETIQRAAKTLRPLALQWFAKSSEKEKIAA